MASCLASAQSVCAAVGIRGWGGGIDGEQISIMMSYSDVYMSHEQPSVSNHRERPEKGTVAWMIYRRWG